MYLVRDDEERFWILEDAWGVRQSDGSATGVCFKPSGILSSKTFWPQSNEYWDNCSHCHISCEEMVDLLNLIMDEKMKEVV